MTVRNQRINIRGLPGIRGHVMLGVVLFLFLTITIGAFVKAHNLSAHNVPLDQYRFSMPIGGDMYDLSHIQSNSLYQSIYGVYRDDPLGGTELHLFPDNTFIWNHWFDIGPDNMVGEGTYRFRNGRVILKHSYIAKHQDGEIKDATYHVFGGYRRSDSNIVSDYKTIIMHDDAYNYLKQGGEAPDYTQRTIEYHDWKSIQAELRTTKGTW